MGPLTSELVNSMEALASFMECHDEGMWANQIRGSAQRISNGSYDAVDQMRFWWGTYGTLNDIVIQKIGDDETIESANEEFSRLQEIICELRIRVMRNAVFE